MERTVYVSPLQKETGAQEIETTRPHARPLALAVRAFASWLVFHHLVKKQLRQSKLEWLMATGVAILRRTRDPVRPTTLHVPLERPNTGSTPIRNRRIERITWK